MKINKRKLRILLTECGYLGYHANGEQYYHLKELVNVIADNFNYIIEKKGTKNEKVIY